MEATGTEKKDWFEESVKTVENTAVAKQREQQQRGKVVAAFPYQDAEGHLLYEALRIEPGRDGRKKDFSFRRPQPGGKGWIYNLEGVEKVLYRLPELNDERKKQHPVFVVEGEGKVEALRKLGFLATSSPCGAGNWLEGFGALLAGRRVVVLPDNDAPGWKHAWQVAANLLMWGAAAIWVMHLPGLPEGCDIVDWLRALTSPAHQRAQLIEAVKESQWYELKTGAVVKDGA